MAGGDEGPPSDDPPTSGRTDATERPADPDAAIGDLGIDADRATDPGVSGSSDGHETAPGDHPDHPVRAARGPTEGAGGRREVEVPRALYKVVTVFSTLLAVVFVVLGFAVLDMATTVLANPPGSTIVRLLSLLGPSVATLSANASTIAVVVGLLGLASIVAGAGVYVYGSRFRAPGMGTPKDEAGEGSDDG